jgi:uncharacterized protein YeeX (DUF496 family)
MFGERASNVFSGLVLEMADDRALIFKLDIENFIKPEIVLAATYHINRNEFYESLTNINNALLFISNKTAEIKKLELFRSQVWDFKLYLEENKSEGSLLTNLKDFYTSSVSMAQIEKMRGQIKTMRADLDEYKTRFLTKVYESKIN